MHKAIKIPPEGDQKIRSLLKSFKDEEIFNKRIAIVGVLILVVTFPAVYLYEKVSENFISPEYIFEAGVVELFEAQKKVEDCDSYKIMIKTKQGKIVRASVNKDTYSELKFGEKVRVGFFKDAYINRFKIIGKKD